MLGTKKQRLSEEFWSRKDIVSCNCPSLPYKHVHCPCSHCNFAAVSTSTEYTHWKRAEALSFGRSSSQDNSKPFGLNTASDTSAEDPANTASRDNELLSYELNNAHDSDVDIGDCLTHEASAINLECDCDTDISNSVNVEISCAILKALNLVDQMQGSQTDFEDVLLFSKELFCRNDSELAQFWPKNWRETQALLKKCGYKDPRELYVCLDLSHYCHWDVMESPESRCKYCGKKGSIKYYYLSIADKIQQWCANEDMCKKMMAHWNEKEHWNQGVGPYFTLKEVWDGDRFNQLRWFWNPESSWMLPTQCQLCKTVVSTEEILAFPESNGKFAITCNECGTGWMHTPLFAKGDPRNIGLIGHWDGWQPFGFPGTHSCGAIEVTIANMLKAERSNTDQIYVVGFVPSFQLPKSRPCSLDPFLHPLISDIEDIFIKGLQVRYAKPFPCIPAGMMNIRVLILLWTGDYPAQNEVGKFIKHGVMPCRRDKLKGTRDPNGGTTYYYGGNRYHARFPWKERKLEEDSKVIKEIGSEDRKTVCAAKSKTSGYTGLTILYRLHKLYGFDIFKDLVIDTMHNIPTNGIAAQLRYFIQTEKIDAAVVEQRLCSFPWTRELKDDRVPKGFDSRFAFWKAEELHKFAFPASEVIMADLLEEREFHIWQLIIRMTELVFGVRDGWSHDDVNLFEKLAQRYLILTEEQRGITACVITAHNLIHIPQDVLRFGHPDNFWCFSFERAVQRYVKTSCNYKNIECSYAKREARRELLKHIGIGSHPLKQYKVDLEKMCANSLEAAHHLVETADTLTSSQVNQCNKGILVGGLDSKGSLLKRWELEFIKAASVSILGTEDPRRSSDYGIPFKSLLKPQQGLEGDGMLYRSGEYILLAQPGHDQPIVMLVDRFLSVEIEGQHHSFVQGKVFKMRIDEDGDSLTYQTTGFRIIQNSDTTPVQEIIAPVTSIMRKVIVCCNPCESQESIVVDFQRKSLPWSENDVIVPFYPQEGDMVRINGADPEPWLAKVVKVYVNFQTVKVIYYNKTGEKEDVYGMQIEMYRPEGNSRLATDRVPWNSIIGFADGEWNNTTWERPVY